MRLTLLLFYILQITKPAVASTSADTLEQAIRILSKAHLLGTSVSCDRDQKTIPDQCKMHFGWGHSSEAHQTISSRASNDENWVVQGCNIGRAGFGSCMAKKGVFQGGPNGDWFGTPTPDSNGGLHLVSESLFASSSNTNKIDQKINMTSFVRMSQYNWLVLIKEAQQQLLSGDSPKCSEVEISFTCLSAQESSFDTMKESEWNRRLKIAKKKISLKADKNSEDLLEQQKAIDILNRFETLGNCGTSENPIPSIPLDCDQKLTVTANTKITEKKCIDFMSAVEKREMQKSKRDYTLPEISSYPKTGPIH